MNIKSKRPRLGVFLSIACAVLGMADERWDAPGMANPILPGYFADPVVVEYDEKFYLYATLEPWGGETLGCWESDDFKNWTYRELNWPTKAACTSPTSQGAMVWAPSVVQGKDGRFYMHVSVGSEIWAGVADHPLGPWRNALGDEPMIGADFDREYHMIDADVFIDDDGSAYIYWGSGWNWVNGACFAAKLADDYVSFEGAPRTVTPANYFEGPTMLKQDGRYYLTYSNGKTISDTYEVRYAVSDHPLGPFAEGETSPILVTDRSRDVVSPGHHGFFRRDGQVYIVYHRHRIPFVEGTAFRQVCIDELRFTSDGWIEKVKPTHSGPSIVQGRSANAFASEEAVFAASSSASELNGPARAFDGNYATRWAPDPGEPGAWLQIDFGSSRAVRGSELRFEYAWKSYAFVVEGSRDGRSWTTLADHSEDALKGSPVRIEHPENCRYLRIRFPGSVSGQEVGIIDWSPR